MPLYDYDCPKCGYIKVDVIMPPDDRKFRFACPECDHKPMVRAITQSGHYCGNQDAAWLKSVGDVVDKDPSKPHCQAFLKSPTRANYHAMMKGEGIRPMDAGEGPSKPGNPIDDARMTRDLCESAMKRRAVTVGGL